MYKKLRIGLIVIAFAAFIATMLGVFLWNFGAVSRDTGMGLIFGGIGAQALNIAGIVLLKRQCRTQPEVSTAPAAGNENAPPVVEEVPVPSSYNDIQRQIPVEEINVVIEEVAVQPAATTVEPAASVQVVEDTGAGVAPPSPVIPPAPSLMAQKY